MRASSGRRARGHRTRHQQAGVGGARSRSLARVRPSNYLNALWRVLAGLLVPGHGAGNEGWRVGEGRRMAIKPQAPVGGSASAVQGPFGGMVFASILRQRNLWPQQRVGIAWMLPRGSCPGPRPHFIAATEIQPAVHRHVTHDLTPRICRLRQRGVSTFTKPALRRFPQCHLFMMARSSSAKRKKRVNLTA